MDQNAKEKFPKRTKVVLRANALPSVILRCRYESFCELCVCIKNISLNMRDKGNQIKVVSILDENTVSSEEKILLAVTSFFVCFVLFLYSTSKYVMPEEKVNYTDQKKKL